MYFVAELHICCWALGYCMTSLSSLPTSPHMVVLCMPDLLMGLLWVSIFSSFNSIFAVRHFHLFFSEATGPLGRLGGELV